MLVHFEAVKDTFCQTFHRWEGVLIIRQYIHIYIDRDRINLPSYIYKYIYKYIYIYIYICVCVCVCVYIYIYIYHHEIKSKYFIRSIPVTKPAKLLVPCMRVCS